MNPALPAAYMAAFSMSGVRMQEIVFEAPPSVKPGVRPPSPEDVAAAAALRAQPGEWARIYSGTRIKAQNRTAQIKGGRRRQFRPAGSFDATCRRSGNEYLVYARFVGET